MHRRALLTAAATGVVGLAGCLQGPLGVAGGRSPGSQREHWGAEPPCPGVDPTADRTVCTGGGHPTPSGVPVALHPPVDAPLQAGTPFAITLRPRTDVPVTFPPEDWTVRRLRDDRWTDVASGDGVDGFRTVYPGERYEWRLDAAEAAVTDDEGTGITVSLDPGRYAFSLTASVGRGWTEGDRFECIALVAVR